jgi:hypothetical protein
MLHPKNEQELITNLHRREAQQAELLQTHPELFSHGKKKA